MGIFSWRKSKKKKPDDDGSDMSFLDHLEELRWHIIRSVLVVLVIAIGLFTYRQEVIGGIFMTPFSEDFITYRFMCENFDQFCEQDIEVREVGVDAPDSLVLRGVITEYTEQPNWRIDTTGTDTLDDGSLVQVLDSVALAPTLIPNKKPIEFKVDTESFIKDGAVRGLQVETTKGNLVEFQAITPYEQFMKALFYAFFGGLIFAFPYVSWELWRFISPALSSREATGIRWNVFSSSMLFFTGILFGYFIILPFSITFLSSFVLFEEASNIWRIGDVVNFVLVLLFGTGFLFQLPVVVYYLSKIGILTPKSLRKYRRHAVVGMLVVAAIVTPPDPMSQVLIFFPLLLLYEAGIVISGRVLRKRKAKEAEEKKKDEAYQARKIEELKAAAEAERERAQEAEEAQKEDEDNDDDGPEIDLRPPEGSLPR